ncbi:hypothetical protein DZC76_09180 [Pseudomonas sp. phDV1]|uniref:hypothetical protein n=1 Tax=Pseudomonadaceae TaxID=135621 RepID=UPI000C27E954|nr:MULTISPECIES: hypothetical protein [Pseudomonas]AXO61426.1 hypothetical protein DZC76_09180 [Pseudomonas sp. phDV1]PPV41453.1 hypothetical protein C5L43_06755 [Pseudomonas oleovorans]TXR33766.1 hypothetical protein FVE88_21595 [Pseudomonas mendocina]
MRYLTLLPLLVLVACGQGDNGVMAKQADATKRFYSGCARHGEFLRLTDLPAIPPSFDEDAQ